MAKRKRDYAKEYANRKAKRLRENKPRDTKKEYRDRVAKGLRDGYTRSQAAGKPRKGELTKTLQRKLITPGKGDFLLERIYDRLDGDERAKAIELYKCASKQLDSKGRPFRRRTSPDEKPTCMDLLLMMLSDTEQAEFSLGMSEPTTILVSQLRSGRWGGLHKYLPGDEESEA